MATLRIIDGNYVLDWRDSSKKRHRDPLGKVGVLPKRDAERILKQRELELATGYRILNPPSAPAFSAFVTDYLAWHAAEYPASHFRVRGIVEQHLLPHFAHTTLEAFTPRQVEEWKRNRLVCKDRGCAPKSQTVTKELRTLKAILNKAIQWGDLSRNPIMHVEAPKKLDSKPPRFFTIEELRDIYAACSAVVNNGQGPQPEPMHAHMWRLFANTGMRRTEGLMLRRKWVGREAMKILSTDEHRTKSGKWREIPLTAGARQALEELPREGEYVLPRMALESLSRAAIRDIRRAGVEDGSIHTFRHTYCSHLVMAGVPLRTVQKLAGHSTIAVTENYAHLSPDYLKNAGRAISL